MKIFKASFDRGAIGGKHVTRINCTEIKTLAANYLSSG
jgi:hypothetical protein